MNATTGRDTEVLDVLLREQIELFEKAQVLVTRWLDAALADADADAVQTPVGDLVAMVSALSDINSALLELRKVAIYLPGLQIVEPSSTVEPTSIRPRPRRVR
jgi:hypothetical protein